MSDLQGMMRSVRRLHVLNTHQSVESPQTEGAVIDFRRKSALSLIPPLSQVYEYLTFARKAVGIIRHLLPSPFAFPRRATATASILHRILIYTAHIMTQILAVVVASVKAISSWST